MEAVKEEKSALLFMQVLCLLTGIVPLLAFPVSAMTVGLPKTILWMTGAYALLVLMLPVFFLDSYDIFEPICFAMLMVVLGTTLRSLYIAFFDNDSIRFDMLLGKPPGALIGAGLIIIAGLAAFVGGYMVKTPRMDLKWVFLFKRERWNGALLILAISVLCMIGIIATYLYLREMGVKQFVLSNISNKRFFTVAGGDFKSSLSYYRWAASATQPAFFLFFTWFAASGKRFFSIYLVPTVILCALAMAFPIINSSRSGALEVILIAMVIWHYIRGGITVGFLFKVLVFAMAFIMLMSFLRKKPESITPAHSMSTVERAMDIFIGNLQYVAIDKMQQIADAMPERYNFQYGNTLLTFLYAPIPRTSWPEKPPVMLGPEIASEIYGIHGSQGGGGIPPGFLPELYMNFHVIGVVVGMFILGLVLKFMYVSFRPLLARNKNAVILYVPLMMNFSLSILANSFSAAVILAAMQLTPIFFALLLISSPGRVRS